MSGDLRLRDGDLGIEEFKAAVRAYAVTLADGLGRWGYETTVKYQLARHKLDAGTVFSAYADAAKAGRVLGPEPGPNIRRNCHVHVLDMAYARMAECPHDRIQPGDAARPRDPCRHPRAAVGQAHRRPHRDLPDYREQGAGGAPGAGRRGAGPPRPRVVWQTTAAAEPVLAGQGQRAERTVLVLTALPEEYVAVRQRLGKGEELRGRGGARYLKATLSGVSIRWTAYVFEVGMGNASAASVIGTAVEELSADLVVFVGIAAGTKPDDHEHGDVVIADRVYNAHAGKFVTDQDGQPVFRSRPKGRDTAYPLVQLARQLARMPGRALGGAGRKPGITVGSIASTEAVIADQNSQIFRHIRNEPERLRRHRHGDLRRL